MKTMKLFGMLTLILGLTLISCSGDDGKDGIDGIDGINGTNGTDGKDGTNGENGTNGADGTDGIGFDELAQFGFITLKMEGVRVDNVAFQDSTSFKFMPADGFYVSQFSAVNSYLQGEDQWYDFFATRFISTPDDIYQNSYMSIVLSIGNIGQANQDFYFSYGITDYAVIGDDQKYFIVDHSYDTNSLVDFKLIDPLYDPDSHHLTFSFDFTLEGAQNVTGNPLHISGTVDVIVLEQIM